MAFEIFIDGEAGTTGLQVSDRLVAHPDMTLIQLDDGARKNPAMRKEAMAAADAVVLCLPDAAAIEAVALADTLPCKIIDASTAHRTHPQWVYGFAEMCANQRERIRDAQYIANPGCYSTATIAMLRPLIDGGLLCSDAQLYISALSGYSGGGKPLINYMGEHSHGRDFAYALGLDHKHLPEVMLHSGLTVKPVFMPLVGGFDCGMLVQLPLTASQLTRKIDRNTIYEAYCKHYSGEAFIKVSPPDDASVLTEQGYFVADALNGSNRLEVGIFGNDTEMLVLARLDNLGKGAAGAAVQNLNIALGLEETTGLL